MLGWLFSCLLVLSHGWNLITAPEGRVSDFADAHPCVQTVLVFHESWNAIWYRPYRAWAELLEFEPGRAVWVYCGQDG